MGIESRRRFLERSVACALSGGLRLAGKASLPGGGKLLGTVPFVEEGNFPLDTIVGAGLGGRLALDLSTLTPDTLVTPNDKFFIRTRCPDQLGFDGSWKIAVGGLVETPLELTLEDLLPQAAGLGTFLIECAGNDRAGHYGLISAARWTGISIPKVLERVRIRTEATRVLISGFDKHSQADPASVPGASWIFALEHLKDSRAFLATAMNGAPIPRDHGHPIRLVVPGWYACACIKWVNEIVLLDDEAPATDQMMEYSGRTHQDAIGPFTLRPPGGLRRSYQPVLARQFKHATIDLAATPVRVERWLAGGKNVYRVWGILWGGDRLTKALVIRFNPDMKFAPVQDYDHKTNDTWILWSHTFQPTAPGRYRIELAVDDKGFRTRRLGAGFYVRTVDIAEV